MKSPRWSPRQWALGRLSIEQIRRGHVKPYERASVDCDYLDALPEAERIWMANFLNESHSGNFTPGEQHIHPPALRREVAARVRSHARDRRPDALTYPSGYLHESLDVHEDGAALLAEAGERIDGPHDQAEDAVIAEVEARRRARWAAGQWRLLAALEDSRTALREARAAVRGVRHQTMRMVNDRILTKHARTFAALAASGD